MGVARHSLEGGDVEVTLPQLRLLMVLKRGGHSEFESGGASTGCCRIDGHPPRGISHGVVTLESTARGRAVVEQVNARRQDELRRILDQLDPTERSDCAATLRRIHECLDGTTTPPALSSLLR